MLEIDITLIGPQGSGKAKLARKLLLYLRQNIDGEAHLVISSTNGKPLSNNYDVEHCGVIGRK